MKSPLKIGEKVRIIRLTTGLSQTNMGTQLGISQQSYQKIEEGKTIMTETRLTEIAKILDVTEQEIRDIDKIPIINKNLKHCQQFGNFKPVYYNERKSDENIIKDKEIEELKGEVSSLKSMVFKLMQKLGVNNEEIPVLS